MLTLGDPGYLTIRETPAIGESELTKAGWVKGYLGMWDKGQLTFDPMDHMVFTSKVSPYKSYGYARSMVELASYETAIRELGT